MKKILLLISALMFSISSHAAFMTVTNGQVTDVLSVELDGTPLGDGLDATQDVFASVQFLISALDQPVDDLNQDGLLTVQFFYFDSLFTPLGFDPFGYSVFWPIASPALTPFSVDLSEIVFTSNVKNVLTALGAPITTGEANDFYVAAYVEGAPFPFTAPGAYGINLVAPDAEPVSAPSMGGFMLATLLILGFVRRSAKK